MTTRSDKRESSPATRATFRHLVTANCQRRGVATPEALTPFQEQVLQALCEVPSGRVTTYGRLAQRIGCGSARAVGGALSRNPFAPEVPCHRVIGSNLSIGGFHGGHESAFIRRKLALLRAEGVGFSPAKRLTNPDLLFDFGSSTKP